jgi:uncharacterized alkaline shock family protein YloU
VTDVNDVRDARESHPDTLPDDVTLARAALGATRAVPGVAGISRGRYALARTFGLGGETVEGVQLTHGDDGLRVAVHVVVWLVPIPPLADAVRAAVALAVAGAGGAVAAVDVWVDDLRAEGDAETEEARG